MYSYLVVYLLSIHVFRNLYIQLCSFSFSNILLFLPSITFAQIQSPKNHELRQEVEPSPPPPCSRLHSHSVKPELQEVGLGCIMSGDTNYSLFIFLFQYIFLLPRPFSFIYCLDFKPLREEWSGEIERFSTCVISKTELHLSFMKMKWNEQSLWLNSPPNSGKYLHPEDLRYSCSQYPCNTSIEFPKRTQSRFIWGIFAIPLNGWVILLNR